MFSGSSYPYYSRTVGGSRSTAEKDRRPSTLNLGASGSSASGGGGSSYNATGGIVGTLGGGGRTGAAPGSSSTLPNKPSRYLSSSGTSAAAEVTTGAGQSTSGSATSGTGLGGGGGTMTSGLGGAASSGRSGSTLGSGLGSGGVGRSSSSSLASSSVYGNQPSSSLYSTYGNQRLQQQQQQHQQQQVITVPPTRTSTLSLNKPPDLQSQTQIRENPLSSSSSSSAGLSSQYYKSPSSYTRPVYHSPYQQPYTIQLQQPQSIHQHQQIIERPLSTGVTASKSTHDLIMDSVPDNIFCLSCPPAEFKFSDAYRAKTLPRTGKENERLIGFATLPEQVHRKSVKKGFDFTLMVIGESGLGKSTLINSLFLADFYQNRKIPNASEYVRRTTSIQKHTIEIEERGVKLRLTVVDTPGFGDALNCEDSWKPCVEYIDDQFSQYFQAESGLNRRHIQDTRVHCCLYFIPPYGHGLRALDIQVLKNLQNRVNVIPVIAKADTLTPTEVKKLKDHVLDDLRNHQIQIYQFPECDEEEDEEFKKQDRELKAAIPFAVASSETFVEVAGKRVRGRQYPWGIVEVENPKHSDFSKLRTMLIQSHMHDLKETTQDMHYENFRAKAIAQISNGTCRERSKLKRDSSYDSPQDLIQQKEAEIKRMQQMISTMEARLKAANQPKSMRDSIIDL